MKTHPVKFSVMPALVLSLMLSCRVQAMTLVVSPALAGAAAWPVAHRTSRISTNTSQAVSCG